MLQVRDDLVNGSSVLTQQQHDRGEKTRERTAPTNRLPTACLIDQANMWQSCPMSWETERGGENPQACGCQSPRNPQPPETRTRSAKNAARAQLGVRTSGPEATTSGRLPRAMLHRESMATHAVKRHGAMEKISSLRQSLNKSRAPPPHSHLLALSLALLCGPIPWRRVQHSCLVHLFQIPLYEPFREQHSGTIHLEPTLAPAPDSPSLLPRAFEDAMYVVIKPEWFCSGPPAPLTRLHNIVHPTSPQGPSTTQNHIAGCPPPPA